LRIQGTPTSKKRGLNSIHSTLALTLDRTGTAALTDVNDWAQSKPLVTGRIFFPAAAPPPGGHSSQKKSDPYTLDPDTNPRPNRNSSRVTEGQLDLLHERDAGGVLRQHPHQPTEHRARRGVAMWE